MNDLTAHLTELDNQIGFQERNRLGTQERVSAINQALFIAYGLLQGSPIIKTNNTITVASSVATPPSDFNEGVVLYMGDSNTYDTSSPVAELNDAYFGRLDSSDSDFFTQNFNATTFTPQFEFNSISAATLYLEYERGAPILSNGTDDDGLPKGALFIIARLSAGILNENLLADTVKMQTYLYGADGNPSKYTPSSVMGMLSNLSTKRKAGARKAKTTRITLNDSRKNYYR